MRRAWIPALLAALAAAPAAVRAADDAPAAGQGPYVVLIGVGQFDDPAIQPRPTAEADAKAFYDLATDPKYMGVPADRVVLLTATPDKERKSKPATRENVVKALHDAVAKTTPC